MGSFIMASLILELGAVITYASNNFSPLVLFLGFLGWAATVAILSAIISHDDKIAHKRQILQRAKDDSRFEFFQVQKYDQSLAQNKHNPTELEFENF